MLDRSSWFGLTCAWLLVAACGAGESPADPAGSAGAGAPGAAGSASLTGGAGLGAATSSGGAGAATSGNAGTNHDAGMPAVAGSAGSAGAAGTAGGGDGGAGGMTNATGGTGGGSSGAGGSLGGSGGSGGSGPKPAIKVWLAGDSTMQSCSSACPCGWGSRFDELFDDGVTVVNRAVGGRSIQTWLYEGAVSSSKDASGECALTSTTYAQRWLDMLDANSGMKPGDYLFVQFGINDSDSNCPRHVGLEKLKSYMKVMADAAKSRGALPIFVTPVSAIECSGSTAVGTRGSFVTATKEAATANGTTLIDLHQLSVDRYTALGLCPNDDNYSAGKVGAFFCEDHTHFESAGAVEIARLVAKATATAKLPLAAYLKP